MRYQFSTLFDGVFTDRSKYLIQSIFVESKKYSDVRNNSRNLTKIVATTAYSQRKGKHSHLTYHKLKRNRHSRSIRRFMAFTTERENGKKNFQELEHSTRIEKICLGNKLSTDRIYL